MSDKFTITTDTLYDLVVPMDQSLSMECPVTEGSDQTGDGGTCQTPWCTRNAYTEVCIGG
jgi:hypothetical protein